MNTTAITYTCEPDEDFAVCDTCERTIWDDTSYCEEAGWTTCGDCFDAEMRYYERACRTMVPPASELRRLHEETVRWCGAGSDEAIKSGMLVR